MAITCPAAVVHATSDSSVGFHNPAFGSSACTRLVLAELWGFLAGGDALQSEQRSRLNPVRRNTFQIETRGESVEEREFPFRISNLDSRM